jgi:prepilin-type N-terminal cleavage/methylation domain-containing protein
MKGGKTPAGYTIIEVMIVLAVSGLMFIIASTFISGKQEATSFPQGVNELAANLQNTIVQVENGQYSDISLSCTFSGGLTTVGVGAGSTSTNSTSGDTQGQQPQCIYLGKVVHFAEIDQYNDTPTDQYYETFSLAGGRLDNNNNPILADSTPTPLDNVGPKVISTLTKQSIVPQHLDIINMGIEPLSSSYTPPNPQSYGIAFIQSLGSADQHGSIQIGSGPIGIYYVNGLGSGISYSAAPGDVSGNSLYPLPQNYEFVMCITDKTKYAYIEIGNENNQLKVNVHMLGSNTCS